MINIERVNDEIAEKGVNFEILVNKNLRVEAQLTDSYNYNIQIMVMRANMFGKEPFLKNNARKKTVPYI